MRPRLPPELPRSPSRLWPLVAFGVVLVGVASGWIDRPEHPPAPVASATSPQAPVARPLAGTVPEPLLLQQLAVADQQWRPRAEPLPGGGTRYFYKRRPGEPDLTVEQIKALMDSPPTFDAERRLIRRLWRRLDALGIRLELSQPRKVGAAGEWDPALRTLRFKPEVLDKGSREFARVLNHEAIHVAQSCAGGSLRAQPRPLGLSQQLPESLQSVLEQPTYASASARERQLEREAYANQDQLGLGLQLISRHC